MESPSHSASWDLCQILDDHLDADHDAKMSSKASASDVRVLGYEPLIQPALLTVEVPLSEASKATVAKGRAEAAAVITGSDDRVLVIVGPCSVHNPAQAIEYAKRLREKVESWSNLVIVMCVQLCFPCSLLCVELVAYRRVYPEKPR